MTLRIFVFAAALAWAIVNVAGLGFAVAAGEAGHSGVHFVLAVGFGWLAYRFRPTARKQATEAIPPARVESLEAEISDLQRQLNETQRGLEFTEQLLAKRPPEQSRPNVSSQDE